MHLHPLARRLLTSPRSCARKYVDSSHRAENPPPFHFLEKFVPTVAPTETWFDLDGQRIAGSEARLLSAFLSEVPELRIYNLADVHRVLLAARRVLAKAAAQADADATVAAGTAPGAGAPATPTQPLADVESPPALPATLPPQWSADDTAGAFAVA
jgi:hypothetical protein